jgi:hypothetical protein
MNLCPDGEHDVAEQEGGSASGAEFRVQSSDVRLQAECLGFRQDAAEQSANFFACMKKFGKSPLFEISAIVSKIQPCLRLEIFAVGIRQL